MPKIAIQCLETVSVTEANAYLETARGDELMAAYQLATDRNILDGTEKAPDATEIHHALYLLRKARGLEAPSYDGVRAELKRRIAA